MKKPQDQITSKENPTKKIKKINVNSLQTLPENGRGGSTSKFTLRGQHFFLGSKIAADSDCNHEIKRCLLLGRKAMTNLSSVQLSTVAQSCPTVCDPMDCNMPGLPVHHQLLELTQTHVHWIGDAIQSSHPLSSPSPLVLNLSQHQGLFKWVSSSHQVATILELQLQCQSFRWMLGTDLP